MKLHTVQTSRESTLAQNKNRLKWTKYKKKRLFEVTYCYEPEWLTRNRTEVQNASATCCTTPSRPFSARMVPLSRSTIIPELVENRYFRLAPDDPLPAEKTKIYSRYYLHITYRLCFVSLDGYYVGLIFGCIFIPLGFSGRVNDSFSPVRRFL